MGQSCWKSGDKPDGDAAEGRASQSELSGVVGAPSRGDPASQYAEAAGGSAAAAPETALRHRGLHGGSVYSVESLGGNRFATGGEDGRVCLVDISNPRDVSIVASSEKHADDARRLFFHPGQSLLASSGRDKVIKTWRVGDASIELAHTFEGHTFSVANVCMNETGDRMASGSRDNTVRLWDTAAGQQLHVQKTARNLVHCLAWVDEHTVIQGGENLKLYIWDVRGDRLDTHGRAITGVPDQPVCMTKDPSNPNHVYVGYKGFTDASAVVRLWDVRAEKEVLQYVGHDKCLSDIAFSNGMMGTVAHDRSLRLWNKETGECNSVTPLSLDGQPIDFTLAGDHAVVTTTEGETCVYRHLDDGTDLFELRHKFQEN